jgi:hypothetical protein
MPICLLRTCGYTHLAYHFGMNHVIRTIKHGTILDSDFISQSLFP